MAKGISAPALTKFILGIIFISSLIYLGIVGYQAYSLKNSILQKQDNLKLYKKEGLNSLERKKVRLEKELQTIENSYKEIAQTLSSKPKSRMPTEVGDPLKFKEELYKVQTKLKQDGSAIGFQFPPGLGFAKYEKEIPTASDLPIRVKQLEIIQEIGALMLKSRVPQITVIEFKDVKDVITEGDKEVVYKGFPLKIAFRCKNDNLINLLYGLSVSDIPFMVESLNLKTSEGKPEAKGDLTVELEISSAIFP